MEQVTEFLDKLFTSFNSRESIAFMAFMLGAFLLGLIFSWLIHGLRARRRRKENAKLEQQVIDLKAAQTKHVEELELKEADLAKALRESEQRQTANEELRKELESAQKALFQRNEENEKLQVAGQTYAGTIDELHRQVLELKSTKAESLSSAGVSLSDEEQADALFRLQQLEGRMNQLEQTNQALSEQLDTLRDQAEMQAATGSAETLDLTEAIAPSEGGLIVIDTTVDERDTPTDLPLSAAAPTVSEAAPIISEAAPAVGAPVAATPDYPKDDLTRIFGIGPKIEGQLNEIGITSFQQLADLDGQHVRELTKAIRLTEGRIDRDDWVGQAQEFLNGPDSSVTTDSVVSTDDLKVVEGIGPKIEEVLKKGGINSLEELADANVELLQGILSEAGKRYKMHDPSTWSQQAQMAVDGKLEELRDYQAFLSGGKVKK